MSDIISNVIDVLWEKRNRKEHIPSYHSLVHFEHLRKKRIANALFKVSMWLVRRDKEVRRKLN